MGANERHHDEIASVLVGETEQPPRKCAPEQVQMGLEPRPTGKHVRHQDSIIGEGALAVLVEGSCRKLRCASIGPVTIDEKHLRRAGKALHERCPIPNLDPQPLGRFGKLEELARRGDNFASDLHRRNPGIRHPRMHELRERAAAQPNHDRVSGRRHEQEEGQHAAGVGEFEVVRAGETHRALDRLAAQVQIPNPVALAHLDAVPRSGLLVDAKSGVVAHAVMEHAAETAARCG